MDLSQYVSIGAVVAIGIATIIGSFVLERLKSLAQPWYDDLPPAVTRWAWVPGFAIMGLLVFATGVNAFPIFDGVVEWGGRVVTVAAGALGPSAWYDLWDRIVSRPEVVAPE